jgi:hypothetical protein
MFHFNVDEASMGIPASSVCSLLKCEGVRARHGYLRRPLFCEPVLAGIDSVPQSSQQGCHGGSWRHEFPGTAEFLERSILMGWSNRIRTSHVDGIARAVEKVTEACARISRMTQADAMV